MMIRVVPMVAVAASLLFTLPSAAAEHTRATGAVDAVTVRGTVEEIDRTRGTVALVGRDRGVLVLEVAIPQSLEAVIVGDPVIAQYYDAVAIEVPGSGRPAPDNLVRIIYARALAVTLDKQ